MGDAIAIELDAVFQAGVLRPVVPLTLPEGARVHLVVQTSPATDAEVLELAGLVYDGLTAEQVADIEAISLDRSRFLGR